MYVTDISQLTCLSSESMPSISSSTQIFANAPVGTEIVLMTVRAAAITMEFDGTAATAGANGHDYAVTTAGVPHEFRLNQTAALLVRAIEQAATATGWISYFKVK